MTGIQIIRVSKRFGRSTILDAVSASVPTGSVHGLLGFNGAGKSTLIDIIATLVPPTSGEIHLDGVNIAEDPMGARRQTSTVFESAVAPRPTWTIREYLAFFRRLRGDNDNLDSPAIAQLGLASLLDRRTGTLSAGERKRVEIARALQSKPNVLLLDEPTKEIDIKGKRIIWDTIATSVKSGLTVLVATHDVQEILEICDAATVLHQGRVACRLTGVRGESYSTLEARLIRAMEGDDGGS